MRSLSVVLVIFFLLCSSASFSQGWKWAKANTGGYGDGLCATTDKQGNVYIAGINSSDSSISFSGRKIPYQEGSGFQIVIVKYDSSGNILWAIGNKKGNALPISMTVDTQGDLILFGSFDSAVFQMGTATLKNPSGSEQSFIAKFDAGGEILWARKTVNVPTYFNADTSFYFLNSSANFIAAGAITTDAIGNIYVSTSFKGRADTIAAYILTNADTTGGSYDIVLAKFDAFGNAIWAKSVGGTKNDYVFSIAVTPAYDIYICGIFASESLPFGSSSVFNHAKSDSTKMFIARYDSSGTPLWAEATGSGNEYASSLAVTTSGDIYLLGGFEGSGIKLGGATITNQNAPHSSFFLAKFNAANQVEWYKTGRGTDNISGYNVATDPCGDAWIIGGMFHGNLHDPFHNTKSDYVDLDGVILYSPVKSFDPVFVACYTFDGSLIRSDIFPSGGDDECAITCDLWGNAYIVTDYYSSIPIVVNNSTLPYVDSFDYTEYIYVAKYQSLLNCYDSVLLRNECDTGLIIPNAFTPNNDGKNDFFHPSKNATCQFTDYIFSIFNRWGQQVFTTHDPDGKWDGNFLGTKAELGVYMYFLEYKLKNDPGKHFKKGDVTLVR